MFSKIERDLAALTDSGNALDVLVSTAVETVPGAQFAGITIGRNGQFATPSATNDIVSKVDEIQYRLGTGPCVDAVLEDLVFNARDLRTDARWAPFGKQAYAETGVVSMLSFRLFMELDADVVAGLNMYSTEPDAFDDDSESVGALMATHGALAMAHATAREKASNLTVALKTSREIGIAMGVLMNRHRISRDEAFDLLRIASQHTHRKLALVAADVAETGQLPYPAGGARNDRSPLDL